MRGLAQFLIALILAFALLIAPLMLMSDDLEIAQRGLLFVIAALAFAAVVALLMIEGRLTALLQNDEWRKEAQRRRMNKQ